MQLRLLNSQDTSGYGKCWWFNSSYRWRGCSDGTCLQAN